MAISQKDIKLLWSRAAGRCSICRKELSQDKSAVSGSIIIGEQAHIVAEEADGPRGSSTLSIEERNSYFNLILLCPNHHTLIDKMPDDYPIEKLYTLKAKHELWVQLTLSKEARRDEIEFIPVDDLLELHEKIRPIILWLHRIVPKENAHAYFCAMQEFWMTSNAATDHVPPALRRALEMILRPVAASHYIFKDGREYADSKTYIGVSLMMGYFAEKGFPAREPDRDDKAEDMIRDLNAYLEIVQSSASDLTETELSVIKFSRQLTQYFQKHFANKGPVEITDSFTDQFLAILSPFLFDRLGVIFPDKEDDRALDRIKQYAKERSPSF